jgi:hypothetical protein
VLPDLSKVQSGCSFCIDSHVCRDEMCSLGYTVNNYHDCIIAMSLGELNNEVNTDDIPLILWSLCGVKLSIGSTVLQLSLVA